MSRFLFLFRESSVTKKTGCSDFKFLVAPLLFFSQLASTIVWAAYLFVFGSGVAVAERVESKHVNERYGFSISYPSPIFSEQITPPDSAVALVLSGQNGFPTFTVAVAEGGYQPISDDAHVAQLLREYKRAGFVDARAVRVSRYTHRGVPLQSPLVTILFSTPPEAIAQRCKEGAERVRGEEENSDESSLMQSSRAARSAVNLSLRSKGCEEYIDQKQWLIRSKVVLISTPSRHFVLTYMDFADSGNFEQAITLFNRFKIGLNENQGAGEQVEERSEKADRSPNSYGLMRGLFGWVAPAMTGLVQSSEDTKRYQIEKIDDEASPSLRPFEKIEDSSEIRAQPRWSEFTKIVLPNSQGGQLFGALTLFTSGIILNRLRRR
jgi:hypothetical protein